MHFLESYVSKNEILRYLKGGNGQVNQLISEEVNEQIHALIDSQLSECFNVISPKNITRRFKLKMHDGVIELSDQMDQCVSLIHSNDLFHFLEGAHEVVLGALTLGSEISKRIEKKMLIKPSEGIVLNACASVIADAYADYLQNELLSELDTESLYISQRFSPGYGDLALTAQESISNLLEMRKRIGVYLTEQYQMLPEKSITFIIGLSHRPFQSEIRTCGTNCQDCKLIKCAYRRTNV